MIIIILTCHNFLTHHRPAICAENKIAKRTESFVIFIMCKVLLIFLVTAPQPPEQSTNYAWGHSGPYRQNVGNCAMFVQLDYEIEISVA